MLLQHLLLMVCLMTGAACMSCCLHALPARACRSCHHAEETQHRLCMQSLGSCDLGDIMKMEHDLLPHGPLGNLPCHPSGEHCL